MPPPIPWLLQGAHCRQPQRGLSKPAPMPAPGAESPFPTSLRSPWAGWHTRLGHQPAQLPCDVQLLFLQALVPGPAEEMQACEAGPAG